MSESRDPIEIACPKCRYQVHPSLTGQQIDIDMRCPNCGQLLGVEPTIHKKILQAIEHEDMKRIGQRGEH